MKLQLVDSVKYIIDWIIKTENYETPPDVDVTQGSADGDGYASKTCSISITSNNKRTINLFVKYVPEIKKEWTENMAAAFKGEFRFYNTIYPEFSRFQERRNIKEPFDNVPKHYGTSVQNDMVPPIVLENLRSLGYTLRDRTKPVDDDHLKLAIKAFARYHAISYAMKDQEPELYKNLSAGIVDIFMHTLIKFKFDEAVAKCVDQFLKVLDPIADKKILDRCGKNFAEVLTQHLLNIDRNVDDYSAICQGDCWSSNMMFLYDDKTELPIDVKLIDWQLQKVHSPVLDFAYFFYTLATKENLDKADHYINFYYNTLSHRIRELGSDPNRIYPYEIFLEHWRKFSLFGLTLAFFLVKVQLLEKDEVPSLLESEDQSLVIFTKVLKHQDKYIERMRDTTEYFINHGVL